jgi:hypothetical protein
MQSRHGSVYRCAGTKYAWRSSVRQLEHYRAGPCITADHLREHHAITDVACARTRCERYASHIAEQKF